MTTLLSPISTWISFGKSSMERGDKDQIYDSPYSYSVLTGASTSTLLSSFSTMTTTLGELPTTLGESPTTVPPVTPTNQNQTNRVPLAVGLTLGLVVLAVVVFCGVTHIRRRRARRPVDLDAPSVFPYNGPLTRQADQESGIPQDLKGVPQPAGPSAAPMVTVEPSISSSEAGLEPPPSYQTPSYDWRADTSQ